jgi:hypothetical protein
MTMPATGLKVNGKARFAVCVVRERALDCPLRSSVYTAREKTAVVYLRQYQIEKGALS